MFDSGLSMLTRLTARPVYGCCLAEGLWLTRGSLSLATHQVVLTGTRSPVRSAQKKFSGSRW